MKKLKLLLVDQASKVDEKILNLLYELKNITIIGHAENSKEATVIFDIMKPDILLMDVLLPDNSGIGLLNQVKLKNPEAIIIVYSSLSNQFNVNLCVQLGAHYFLKKGKEFDKLSSLLTAISDAQENPQFKKMG